MVSFLFIFISCLVILVLIMAVLIRGYLVVVTVEQGSMSPTLESGDRVLVVRHWPTTWLRKGQIVLVWPSRISSTRPSLFEVKPYIKRIVGLGGETISTSLTEKTETDEPLQHNEDNHQSQQVWHIPNEHIFVRGDNRTQSYDSLAWGPISLQSVLGVVIMKLPRKDLLPPPHRLVEANGLPAGQIAPPFVAQTLNGEIVTLATYSGRAIALLFITPSPLCRKVIPIYAAIASEAAKVGVMLVFVSNAEIQATRTFVDELNIDLPVLVAPYTSNPFFKNYNVYTTPSYCLVNEQGQVQSAGYPSMRWGKWRALAESWNGYQLSVSDGVY